jgi:NADH-quinone oxidoreductase subunit A
VCYKGLEALVQGEYMQSVSAESVALVIGLVVATCGFIALVFMINSVLSPRNPNPDKNEPYECGMDPAGPPWAPTRMRFATLAMLFVLFDAEAVLLFAVAIRLRGSWIAAVEVGAFVVLLGLGLAYAWRKGALEWRL